MYTYFHSYFYHCDVLWAPGAGAGGGRYRGFRRYAARGAGFCMRRLGRVGFGRGRRGGSVYDIDSQKQKQSLPGLALGRAGVVRDNRNNTTRRTCTSVYGDSRGLGNHQALSSSRSPVYRQSTVSQSVSFRRGPPIGSYNIKYVACSPVRRRVAAFGNSCLVGQGCPPPLPLVGGWL
jgi:hypothetical protein